MANPPPLKRYKTGTQLLRAFLDASPDSERSMEDIIAINTDLWLLSIAVDFSSFSLPSLSSTYPRLTHLSFSEFHLPDSVQDQTLDLPVLNTLILNFFSPGETIPPPVKPTHFHHPYSNWRLPKLRNLSLKGWISDANPDFIDQINGMLRAVGPTLQGLLYKLWILSETKICILHPLPSSLWAWCPHLHTIQTALKILLAAPIPPPSHPRMIFVPVHLGDLDTFPDNISNLVWPQDLLQDFENGISWPIDIIRISTTWATLHRKLQGMHERPVNPRQMNGAPSNWPGYFSGWAKILLGNRYALQDRNRVDVSQGDGQVLVSWLRDIDEWGYNEPRYSHLGVVMGGMSQYAEVPSRTSREPPSAFMAQTSTSRQIKVTVVAAYGLIKREVFRLPDPFAVVTIDARMQQTTEVIKGSLSPSWNQHFDFTVKDHSVIKIEIFDASNLDRKKGLGFLGVVNVRVAELDLSNHDVHTFELKKSSDNLVVNGRLALQITLSSSTIPTIPRVNPLTDLLSAFDISQQPNNPTPSQGTEHESLGQRDLEDNDQLIPTDTVAASPITGVVDSHSDKSFLPFLRIPYLRAQRQALNIVSLLNRHVCANGLPTDDQLDEAITLRGELLQLEYAIQRWKSWRLSDGLQSAHDQLLSEIKEHYDIFFKSRPTCCFERDPESDRTYDKLVAYDKKELSVWRDPNSQENLEEEAGR